MSSLASHNTIINCNCHSVSIHSPPCTLGIHAFCLLFPLTYKLIIRAKSCIVYLWLDPTSASSPIINHLERAIKQLFFTRRVSRHWALYRTPSSSFFLFSRALQPPHVADLPLLQMGRGGPAASQKQCSNMR